MEVAQVETEAWHLFQHHHYLDTSLNKTAKCFVAFWRGRPVAFASAIHTPAPPLVLAQAPDRVPANFQGVGIGNAISEFVAGVMKCLGKPYMSTTGNPAMIRHRGAPARSGR